MPSAWTMARLDRRVPIRSGGWGVEVSTMLSDDEDGEREKGGVLPRPQKWDVFMIQRYIHRTKGKLHPTLNY